MADTQKQPLSPLDSNARIVPQQDPFNATADKKVKPAPTFKNESQQETRLHDKLLKQEKTGKQSGPYVSPSDNLLSPASAKLNAFKEKRFSKSVKPRTLFGKPTYTSPLTQNAESQSGNDGSKP